MSSTIVISAAKQLGNWLADEAKYLYSVKDKIESLQEELKYMAGFLRDADQQQYQEEVVRIWVSDVQDLAYDTEDIIERYLHEVTCHRKDGIQNTLKWFSCLLCSSDAKTLHNLGSEINKLTVKKSQLVSWLQMYRQNGGSIRSLEYNRDDWRIYSHTEEDVVGLDVDIRKLVDLLLKTDSKVVAISGIGGLGKTTLAKKVFKHKDIKHHFDHCAWVYISKEFDDKSVFQEVLRQLEKENDNAKRTGEPFPQKEKTIEQLTEEIYKVIQEKRCLVVIDDIWTERSWKKLKPAIESTFATTSSSKILLTTRNEGLLKYVDRSGYLHRLQPLGLDDSWKLLKLKAFSGHGSKDASQVNYEFDPRIEGLGMKMLNHCKGLPIAIVALGGILSTKYETSQWEEVENNLSSYLMGGIKQGGEDGNPILIKVLELSYLDLPINLKHCFLYLGNFPEDYKISTQRLYHLWDAEGLLTIEGEVEKNGATSYDIGERYLNELVQRSMVQVGKFWTSGKIKTCQVHDIMRDFCLKMCKEVSFLWYIKRTGSDVASTSHVFTNEIKKLRRCAVYDENGDFLNTHFQHREGATCLRSLVVFCKVGNLEKIWKAFPMLRVLDLEGAVIYSIYGVENLIHLRYLSLRESGVEVLPAGLYDLKYLETLDLRCGIECLKNEFYKMKRLKHLYLPRDFRVEGSQKLKFPADNQMETIKNFDLEKCEPEPLMQMTHLRVLSTTSSLFTSTFEKDQEELKWVLKAPVIKKGRLINRLNVDIRGDVIKEDPEILSWAARHSCIKKLKVKGPLRLEDRNLGNATTGNSNTLFSDGVVQLSLLECEIGEVDLLALEKLPHLESLSIRSGPMILGARGSNKLSLSPSSFPQLRELDLQYWRPEWEELEVGDGALPNLQRLTLSWCPKLKKAENMPNSLTKVTLQRCEIGAGDLLVALEKLLRLQELVIVPPVGGNNKWSFSPDSFLQLIQLKIYFPAELEEWELEVGDRALPNLENLELIGCKKLNKLKNIPNSLIHVVLQECEIGDGLFLSALEKHSCLEDLRINMSKIAGNKMSFSPSSFPHLTHLALFYVRELEEWVQEVGDEALPNLKILGVIGCKKLNNLKNIPKSLEWVELHGCNIGEGLLLSAFENLPRLERLTIGDAMIASNKLSFSPGSFPQLTQLNLAYIDELEKWEVRERALPTLQSLDMYGCSKLKKLEVGHGALPTLQHLKLHGCSKLKKLPEGLPNSIHIECTPWTSNPMTWSKQLILKEYTSFYHLNNDFQPLYTSS